MIHSQSRLQFFLVVISLLAAAACVREQPQVIVITATFPAAPDQTAPQATLLPTPSMLAAPGQTPQSAPPGRYTVQPGDTLSGIALSQGVSVAMLTEANNITDPNTLQVGQVLIIPNAPAAQGPDFAIVPDNRVVRGPGAGAFDVRGFIASRPGFVRTAADTVDGVTLSAADVIERIALEFSVDARLLLALLELRAGWLSNPNPEPYRQTYPIGAPASPLGFDRNGLYRQLAWTADQLNLGYYRRKYARLALIEFPDESVALRTAAGLNPGTAAIQYMLSLANSYTAWQREVSPSGLYATYLALFGDPFIDALDSLTPLGLEQPALALPFAAGQEWFYTGGPHGGYGSGSAWAAVDFAPPDDPAVVSSACYVSEYFATAVANGLIARTAEGTVILDLDGDGDETTGWSILYLHIDEQDRVAQGSVVRLGDRIGRPSCDGGFSNATHMHIARRYNGEWMPADCSACPPERAVPNFTMGGWTVYGYVNQEYQGYMKRGGEERIADQSRNDPLNRILAP
jgi:LysM repeat protein